MSRGSQIHWTMETAFGHKGMASAPGPGAHSLGTTGPTQRAGHREGGGLGSTSDPTHASPLPGQVTQSYTHTVPRPTSSWASSFLLHLSQSPS